MPEADTIERVTSRRVQVASLPPADSGRGFARLPDRLMDELGLNEGDVIEIVGKRSTAARAIRPYCEAITNAARSGKTGERVSKGEDIGAMADPPAEVALEA